MLGFRRRCVEVTPQLLPRSRGVEDGWSKVMGLRYGWGVLIWWYLFEGKVSSRLPILIKYKNKRLGALCRSVKSKAHSRSRNRHAEAVSRPSIHAGQ